MVSGWRGDDVVFVRQRTFASVKQGRLPFQSSDAGTKAVHRNGDEFCRAVVDVVFRVHFAELDDLRIGERSRVFDELNEFTVAQT